jgi:hypothetical protein
MPPVACPGSGLGLAIVRDVAEGHGGTVFASTPHGGGATVGCSVDAARLVPAPDPEDLKARGSGCEAVESRGRPRRARSGRIRGAPLAHGVPNIVEVPLDLVVGVAAWRASHSPAGPGNRVTHRVPA